MSGLRQHQIKLKNLRPHEQVLHNCTSHPVIHLRVHFYYLMWLLLPFVGLLLLDGNGVLKEARMIVWFLYSCYALIMTTYYFVRGVNFELGGCVITNQRLLRFGYKGLMQSVEREILPHNIEDFKVEKRGVLSVLFNTGFIYITTSNHQTDVLRYVIQPEKVQEAYATMAKADHHVSVESEPSSDKEPPTEPGSSWIDDAIGQPEKDDFNPEGYRKGMIDHIGNVFKKKP